MTRYTLVLAPVMVSLDTDTEVVVLIRSNQNGQSFAFPEDKTEIY